MENDDKGNGNDGKEPAFFTYYGHRTTPPTSRGGAFFVRTREKGDARPMSSHDEVNAAMLGSGDQVNPKEDS